MIAELDTTTTVAAPRTLTARFAFWTMLVFVGTIPLEDVVNVAGVASMTKAIGFVAFALWIASIAVTERMRTPTIVHLFATGFAGWTLLSLLWTANTSVTLAQSFRIVQLVGVVWLVYDQVRSMRAVEQLMRMYVVGTFVASVLTLVVGQTVKSDIRFGPSADAGPNSTGCMLVIGAMFAIYLLAQPEQRRWRWMCWAYLPVGSVAVLLTASRTAAIALALGAAVTFLRPSALTPRRFGALIAAVAIGAVLTVTVVPADTLARLGTTGTELASGTLDNRTVSWSTAWEVFSREPIKGVGAGAFKELNTQIKSSGGRAHNVAVSIAVELGLVGTVLFWSAFSIAALGALRARRRDAVLWLAIIGTWFIAAMSLTWEVRKVTWLVIALLLSVAQLPARSRERAA